MLWWIQNLGGLQDSNTQEQEIRLVENLYKSLHSSEKKQSFNETKINMYLNDRKKKLRKRKETGHEPRNTPSSKVYVSNYEQMWWSGTRSLAFTDNVTAEN